MQLYKVNQGKCSICMDVYRCVYFPVGNITRNNSNERKEINYLMKYHCTYLNPFMVTSSDIILACVVCLF